MISFSLLILLTALASVAATNLFVFNDNSRRSLQEELASVSARYSLAIDQWVGARLAAVSPAATEAPKGDSQSAANHSFVRRARSLYPLLRGKTNAHSRVVGRPKQTTIQSPERGIRMWGTPVTFPLRTVMHRVAASRCRSPPFYDDNKVVEAVSGGQFS